MVIVGAYYKGACYKGACHKGACCKGAYYKGAYRKKSGISSKVGLRGKVGISGKAGIGVSSSKDIFRLFRVPLLLYSTLSVVYSGGVGKWALFY